MLLLAGMLYFQWLQPSKNTQFPVVLVGCLLVVVVSDGWTMDRCPINIFISVVYRCMHVEQEKPLII
jgi:hypothetical protein